MIADVVIVAFRSSEVIERCVRSVVGQPGVGTVIVVDHGDDGSSAIAEGAGGTVIPNPRNPGFGAGQNAGRRATSAPWILMLNPDAVMAPGAVATGLELVRDRNRVALVQGRVEGADRAPERSQGRELGAVHLWGRVVHARRLLRASIVRKAAARVPLFADHATRIPAAPVEVPVLAATAVLARRAALEEVGGFDEDRYFLYGEDLDLCRRLRRAGWTLLTVPDPWATHGSGRSSVTSWDRELEWWRGTMTFAARWWGTAPWVSGMAAAGVQAAVLAARRPRSWRRLLRALVIDPRAARRSRQD